MVNNQEQLVYVQSNMYHDLLKLFAADCLSEHEVLCRLAANDVSVDTGLVYTFLWGPTPSVDDNRYCTMSD